MFNPFRRPPDSVGAPPLVVPNSQMPERMSEKKAARPLLAAELPRAGHHPAADYASLCREGFARNPIAHRCVRLIAESAASVSLRVSDAAAARLAAPAAFRAMRRRGAARCFICVCLIRWRVATVSRRYMPRAKPLISIIAARFGPRRC